MLAIVDCRSQSLLIKHSNFCGYCYDSNSTRDVTRLVSGAHLITAKQFEKQPRFKANRLARNAKPFHWKPLVTTKLTINYCKVRAKRAYRINVIFTGAFGRQSGSL